VGVPGAPVDAGQAAEVSCEGATPGLPIVQHDNLLGLRDLSIQVGDPFPGLLDCLWIGGLADRKLGGFDALEGLAVLSDLGPMPSDLAVTIRGHLTPLSWAKRDTTHFRFATISRCVWRLWGSDISGTELQDPSRPAGSPPAASRKQGSEQASVVDAG
jgi:hypothetical protein